MNIDRDELVKLRQQVNDVHTYDGLLFRNGSATVVGSIPATKIAQVIDRLIAAEDAIREVLPLLERADYEVGRRYYGDDARLETALDCLEKSMAKLKEADRGD